jgi:hypothetical protein
MCKKYVVLAILFSTASNLSAAANDPYPSVIYSHLFFISMVSITAIFAALAVMAVQCVVCNGIPVLINYLKTFTRK